MPINTLREETSNFIIVYKLFSFQMKKMECCNYVTMWLCTFCHTPGGRKNESFIWTRTKQHKGTDCCIQGCIPHFLYVGNTNKTSNFFIMFFCNFSNVICACDMCQIQSTSQCTIRSLYEHFTIYVAV